MLTQIGQKRESNFTEPIGMLEDCHKRIIYFLNTLLVLAKRGRERPLEGDERVALEKALRYFRESAPKHTADEEESLFPRLRQIGTPRVREIFAKIDRLQDDHKQADVQHAEVETIGRRWLLDGSLDPEGGARLAALLENLSGHYKEHLRLEETEVFSVAKEVLSQPAQQSIGEEMAERRGVALHGPVPTGS